MCYAESDDGINWQRPRLNADGSNIILPYDNFNDDKLGFYGVEYLRPDSTTVFIDHDCPKEEKYKLFLRSPGGKFPEHFAEIDKTCHNVLKDMVSKMAKQEGVTEQLKADNQMLWVQKMNSIHSRAEEFIMREYVYGGFAE